jgi:hypothetical protein
MRWEIAIKQAKVDDIHRESKMQTNAVKYRRATTCTIQHAPLRDPPTRRSR